MLATARSNLKLSGSALGLLQIIPTTRTNYGFSNEDRKWRSTTILSLRRKNQVIMIGDSQVSLGSTVCKSNSRKVVAIDNGRVLTGSAGSAADCITILEKLEAKLAQFPGQLRRACVSVTQDWRTSRYPKLDASMLVADANETYLLDGEGDVLEPPDHGVIAVGSGGDFAASAALALLETDWDAERIAMRVRIINKNLEFQNFKSKNFNIGYEYCC